MERIKSATASTSKAQYHACVIPACTGKIRGTGDIFWHCFPNPDLQPLQRDKWIRIVRTARSEDHWERKKNSRICSRHFENNCYLSPGSYKLVQDSTPTLKLTLETVVVDWKKNDKDCPGCTSSFQICLPIDPFEHGSPKKRMCMESRGVSRKRLFSDLADEQDTSAPNVGQPVTPTSQCRIKIDHSYFRSPRTHAENETRKNKTLVSKNEAFRHQISRRDKTIATVKQNLEESKLISAKKLKLLEIQFPELLKEFVENEFQALTVKGLVKGMSYSDEIKKFAVTLNFYSPRAYDFVREHLTLPHPKTITSWMQSSNCDPGFNMEVMQRLQAARLIDTNNMMTDVVFQVDEMAIRKDSPWDPNKHQFVGFVDYGMGEQTGDEPLATNALVGLIAGISGGWKVPIGYIFTNKIDGYGMQQFVSRGFDLLEENGFAVHALVSDGCTSNVAMFERFGVVETDQNANEEPPRFENIIPSFANPSNPEKSVYAVYDVVHMAKLMRNLIAQCKDVEWEHGTIEWRYILALKVLQDEEHIVAANKLDRYHVDFYRHKMNVKLALQTLSLSVANAIDFCRKDLSLPQFKGSESTAMFIREFNAVVDILNSRHPMQSYGKAPLRLGSLDDKSIVLENFAKKLLNMKYSEKRTNKGKTTYVKKYICLGNRKRAPLGLSVTIKSIIAVSKELLQRDENRLKYVLTYRFSQDLIELLFNKIRGRGGRNNNPNSVQFTNIIRRILHQQLLKSNNTGNCVIQMDDEEIPGGLLPLKPKPKPKLRDESNLMELSFDFMNEGERTGFYKNCLAYIAGNVVMKISEKHKCEVCNDGLLDCIEDPLPEVVKKLIIRKDNGGLQTPSGSVYRIIEMTDSVFRNLVAEFNGPPRLQDLDLVVSLAIVKKCIGMNLFPQLSFHIVDFDPVEGESHLSILIKSIVKQFLKVRLFDYGKRYQRSLAKSTSSRHSLTKQILFRNE